MSDLESEQYREGMRRLARLPLDDLRSIYQGHCAQQRRYCHGEESESHMLRELMLTGDPETLFAFTPEEVYLVERMVRGIRCDPVIGETTYGELYDMERALRAQGELVLAKIRSQPLPRAVESPGAVSPE